MMEFDRLKSGDDISEVLQKAFDVELPVNGGWGYEKTTATVIEKSDNISQVQYIFATMRANLEMNMTQPKAKRYAGITLEENGRQNIDECEKVIYTIKAIREDIYEKLIQEYKDGYGKDGFDIQEHFQKREEQTLKIQSDFWFILK